MAKVSNIFAIILASLAFCSAIDVKKYLDLKCDDVNPSVDPAWVGSIPKWYIAMWSQAERIYTGSGHLKKAISDLDDKKDLKGVGNTCGTFKLDGTLELFGVKGTYGNEPVPNGFRFTLGAQTGENIMRFTDNKNFIVMTTCWGDGHSSWIVMTPEPRLEKSMQKKALHYIQSLGYNADHAIVENLDNCDFKGKNEL